jgi:hypothetical protein
LSFVRISWAALGQQDTSTKRGTEKGKMGKQKRTIVFVFFHITSFAGKSSQKSIKNGETIHQDMGFTR